MANNNDIINNQNDPATPDTPVVPGFNIMSIDEFIDDIITRTKQALNIKNYVYQDINTDTLGNEKVIIMDFENSGEHKFAAKISVIYAYENYKRILKENKDPDFDPEHLLDALSDELAELYNAHYINYLKNATAYANFENNLHNADFILSHIYPELIDSNALNDQFDNSELFKLPYSDDKPNLNYEFVILDYNKQIGTKLKNDNEAIKNIDLNKLIQQSIINLNSNILKYITIENIDEAIVKHMLPFELSNRFVKTLAYNLNQKMTEFQQKFHIVSLQAPLISSSILLSRTAMLHVSKTLKAKRKILMIFLTDTDIIAKTIDPDENASNTVNKTAKDYIDNDFIDAVTKIISDDTPASINRPSISKPIIYDVITGDFE